MTQKPPPRRLGHSFDLPPRWAWIAWLVIALGGSVIAIVALWLGKEDVAGTVCAPLVALLGMAVLLYWLNHLAFKTAEPRSDDLSAPSADHNSHTQRS